MAKNLLIDPNALDQEIIRQSFLLQQAGEAHAINLSVRDAAAENLKVVDAEVGLDIREQAAESGERITEAGIASRILTDPRHSKAYRNWLESKEKADLSQAEKEAWVQRGHALHDLAQLWLGQYYSTTSVRNVNPSDVRLSSSEARRSVTEAMEKRKREGERNE